MAFCANTLSVNIPAVNDEVLDDIAPYNVFIRDSTDLKSGLISQWRIGSSLKKPWLSANQH